MSAEQSTDPPDYWLKREWRSSFRLNFNHLIMTQVAGGLLSPEIPTDAEELRIADFGTGTAAWALEAGMKYPNAQIDGFDISDEQFSPLYDVRNVKLIVHDCWKPFPDQYVGKYDIVHARFWLCLINNPDAPRLLKRLVTLLKPGGYLQWFEPQVMSITTWKSDPSIASPITDQLVKLWQKPREDSTYEWVAQLRDSFQSEGLQNVSATTHWLGDQYRQMWMHSNLAGMEDTITQDFNEVGKADQIKAFSQALQGELKKGIAIHSPFTLVVGRKST